MPDLKLVSILLPAYNVSSYICEAVDSILNQDYKSIEVIIVDDCSTDTTWEILNSNYGNEPRIKLFKNKSNLKISKTLNFALSKSSGFYIARMDGDDIALPSRISEQVPYSDASTINFSIVI